MKSLIKTKTAQISLSLSLISGMYGCTSTPQPQPYVTQGCTKDTDCIDGRICDYQIGQCIYPKNLTDDIANDTNNKETITSKDTFQEKDTDISSDIINNSKIIC